MPLTYESLDNSLFLYTVDRASHLRYVRAGRYICIKVNKKKLILGIDNVP